MAQTKSTAKKRATKKTAAKAKSPARKTAKKKTATKATASRSAKSPKKKATKKAAKKTASKRVTKPADTDVADMEVTIDRRNADRRQEEQAAEPEQKLERRQKVNRRRQIDPTTCEREYTDAEVEFMNALDDYKRKSGRMFPTCSEVLEVIIDLGYVKLTRAEMALVRPESESTDTEGEAVSEAESALELSEELRVQEAEPAEEAIV